MYIRVNTKIIRIHAESKKIEMYRPSDWIWLLMKLYICIVESRGYAEHIVSLCRTIAYVTAFLG